LNSFGCNPNCYCGSVLEFTLLLSSHPQDYDDVLNCFHVWVVYFVLGEMKKP
jgi:hypothetical protein